MKYKASLIVPVFNEYLFLNSICLKLKNTFESKNIKFIFVDDGSKMEALDG